LEALLQASDIMTKKVWSVGPETPLREVARLLLDHGISAVPVLDPSGAVVGMVSEGDLMGRDDTEREARRDWWLALVAEGEALHPNFLASLRDPDRKARDIMSAPVVTVGETTAAAEIAALLGSTHVKRVPVLREGKVVGIVSRADLLRAFAGEPAATAPKDDAPGAGLIGGTIAAIDRQFRHVQHEEAAGKDAQSPAPSDADMTLKDFTKLAADFKQHEIDRGDKALRAIAEGDRQKLKTMLDQHVTDESWQSLLHGAHLAAEHGEKELLLLRFPSGLCGDGGRAINVPLPEWPASLRGEAADIYLRWERELKPRGFHLTARVLDFPGGMPGDIGLFLFWGV
jgi:CBS domain-containing protein